MAAWALLTSPGAPVAADVPSTAIVDPRIEAALAVAGGAAVPVWIEFRDRGERDADGLAARLAEAEARLSPRNRARRLRAGVEPLVDQRDLPVHEPYLQAVRALGLEPYGVSRWFNHAAVRVDAAALARLAELPGIARVRPVERAVRTGLPEQPLPDASRVPAPAARGGAGGALAYGRTQGLVQQIQAAAVHDSGYTGAGVLICVLDSGFNGWTAHQALAGLDVPAGHVRDFVDGDTDVTGGFGFEHGTWVLGLIAGYRPGDYVGTGFGATFALARTENASSETPIEMVYWMQGAEWADSLGADIINSSLGYSRFDDPADHIALSDLDGGTTIVSRAAQIAASKGILVVNSAGNEGANPAWGRVVAPADVHGDSLIAAGAVDLVGVRQAFSSMGPTADGRIKPDLMALGGSAPLVSTSNPTGYLTGSGTSFSAPIVAGLAACIMQARPAWAPVDVIRALRETADRWLRPDTLYGYGVPHGLSALRWPSSVVTVPAPVGLPEIALIGPNPMRSDGAPARFRFALHQDAVRPEHAVVRVLDVQGRLVRRLWSGELPNGVWVTAEWDGRADTGERAGAGIYLLALKVAGYRRATRLAWLP